MGVEEIDQILANQKNFFESGKTLDIEYRLDNLKKLRSLIFKYEKDLIDAMYSDFKKPEFEVLGSESRFVIAELNHMIKKLRKWSGKQKVRTSILNLIASSYVTPQPYGQVLILSPWNYPFQLSMVPVLSALAAGNCVVLKVSQKVTNTEEVIARMFSNFPSGLISVIRGEYGLTDHLLNYKFDYIFFTGSTSVGKKVLTKAAENLCPVTLELGGKNPCVVAEDARLDYAAKRIASGKFLNAGQTCIAPDYLLVDKKIKDRFLELLSSEIKKFYGDDPKKSNDFCRIINSDKTERLRSLITTGTVVAGGITDTQNCYVAPTVLTDVGPDDPVMQDEIFGPVLPVITYDKFDDVFQVIDKHPESLTAYIFTTSRKLETEFIRRTRSGSVAVNDTVMQVASSDFPFGGIGSSGMGRYHGRKSFETFSNMRSVMVKSNLIDIPLRYPPYSRFKEMAIKFLMR